MRILIGIAQIPFLRRRTEALADDLCRTLIAHGHQAEIARVPFSWNPPERVLDHVLACRLMDWNDSNGIMGDALIALEFPAYLIHHRRKILWLTHPLRWPSAAPSAGAPPEEEVALQACREAARQALSEAERVFSISATASYELRKLAGADALPLMPPLPNRDRFFWERGEDHLLIPAGVRPAQRLLLVVEALLRCREPVRVRICAEAGDPEPQAVAAAVDATGLGDQVEWVEVEERDPPEFFAGCRAILYPTLADPFDWTAGHAMLASKAMITCFDSGAAAECVRDGVTGLILNPDPGELAAAMDDLWRRPDQARVWGMTARSEIESVLFSWPDVVEKLLGEPPPVAVSREVRPALELR